jgi:hypothetical protein
MVVAAASWVGASLKPTALIELYQEVVVRVSAGSEDVEAKTASNSHFFTIATVFTVAVAVGVGVVRDDWVERDWSATINLTSFTKCSMGNSVASNRAVSQPFKDAIVK